MNTSALQTQISPQEDCKQNVMQLTSKYN